MQRQAAAMKRQAPAAETPPPAATGKAAVRLLAGFAGLGAASVNLAVSSSLFAATGTGRPWQTSQALAAALWGATLLAWTVAALRNGRFPLPRTAGTALQAAAALHVLAIVTGAGGDTAGLSLSHLAALLLTLMIIGSTAWLGRQAGCVADDGVEYDGGRLAAAGGAGTARLLAAAFAGALAVAAIATPGLAASTAGQFAVPHGSHSGVPAGHHGP
jgi:hypothetical protein